MADFIAQNMAPIMFAALVVFLLLGYPGRLLARRRAASSSSSSASSSRRSRTAPITLSWPLLQSLPERIYGVMNNDTLLAIPFFTFMGLILERSGMAEDLLDTIGQLFGTVRGGLAYAVIFVGALLAATTGVVAASRHLDGPHLAADHAALRLRPARCLAASSRPPARWRRSSRRRWC